MARPGVRHARDNLHSRLVAVLKVALPLAALAILSTLFLFSRGIDPEDAIPYAQVDVEDRLREPRMTEAGYSGMTPDGAALTLSAAEARPEAGGGSASGLQGQLATADGARTEIAAMSARIDNTSGQLELSGGVELRSSAGYVIQSEGLALALDRTWLESRGAVSAQGPLGQLTANSLRLDRGAGDKSYLLVFNGKVRLLYQPKQ